MKLYVARHGQTVWNAQNKVCGVTDVELTERGIEQAEKLADIVPDNIDVIITSPLKRAIETGKIVAEKKYDKRGVFNYTLKNGELEEYEL